MNNFIITPKEIQQIANNFIITNHASKRIKERLEIFDNEKIKELILKPHLAWRNTDNTINLAINSTQYFVIKKDYKNYIIITFKEYSKNNITTDTKFAMAFWGKRRK